MEINKQNLLGESKTFCMFPWVHMYVSPRGKVYPCCTTDTSSTLGDTHTDSLKEIWNNDKMKQVRLDMLNGKSVDLCRLCYKMEETTPHTWRRYSNDKFEKYFDETVATTKDDGSVENFKLRFIDIRFSNICNFACRTCGSECSSQFAAEERKLGKHDFIVLHVDDGKGKVLEEVLEHLDHADMVYFAGGEPLITDEHYIILEEIIKRGRTDIKLRYNTNASNIHFKGRNLIDLWNKFSHIEVACSIDHFGERAELIRHGTDWGVVESNLLQFRKMRQVLFSVSTVLSVFNYLTIHDFYNYLIQKNIIFKEDTNHYLCLTANPSFYCATTLPKSLKEGMQPNIEQFCDNWKHFELICKQIRYAINFANSAHTWEENKYDFIKYSWLRDRLRGEDILKVFPELALLII